MLPSHFTLNTGAKIPAVNTIAIVINNFDSKNLRLKQYLDMDFEGNESVKSAKQFFLEGDGSADSDFRGLNNHDHLSKYDWSLELWVLPQIEGCTTLIKWNDVPQLRAQDFCDWRAVQKDEGKREWRFYKTFGRRH